MEIDIRKCEDYINQRFNDWMIYARNYVKDIDIARECVIDFLEKQLRLNNWKVVYLISIGQTMEYKEGFLFTSIKNCCLDYLKAKSNKSKTDVLEISMKISDENHNPEELLINSERNKKIQNAINQLTNREKEIFDEYLNDVSYAQIADKFGISIKTVDNTLQRSKLKLKEMLKRSTVAILYIVNCVYIEKK